MSFSGRSVSIHKSHDKAVRDIAEKRFDNERFDVLTNPGSQKNASVGSVDNPLFPDIVVLERGTGRRTAIAIGEVETVDSVNEEEVSQWADYSKTRIPFYLYVPIESIEVCRRLLDGNSVKIAGLRAYRYDPEGRLVVQNIS